MRTPAALLLLVVLSACSGTAATTTTTTTLPPETTTTSTTPSTTPATTEPAPAIGDGPTSADLAGAVFERTTVENFRARTEVRLSNNRDGTDPVIQSLIDASYQRDPEAVALDVAIDDQTPVSIVGIEDRYFLNEGDGWLEQPLARQLVSLASVSLLAPETVSVILPLLEEGEEAEVAGRSAIHYQGGPETLQVLINATEDPAFASFTEIEYATIDLWVDKAGFLAKAIYDFGGIRPAAVAAEYYSATFEILEYDGDLTIEPPVP